MKRAIVIFVLGFLTAPVQAAFGSSGADWYAQALAVSVRQAVWKLDMDGIKSIADSWLSNDCVVSVLIRDDKGRGLFSKRKETAEVTEKSAARVLMEGNLIGTVDVETALPFDAGAFEKKLADFRYSLYPVLEQIPDEDIQKMDFGGRPEMNKKISLFLSDNRGAVIEYRKAQLKKYAGDPDLAAFTLYTNDPGPVLGQLTEIYGRETLRPYLELASANPLAMPAYFANYFFGRVLGAKQMASRMLKEQIAGRRVTVKETGGDTCEIFWDSYDYLLQFRFDAGDGKTELEKVYSRKTGN